MAEVASARSPSIICSFSRIPSSRKRHSVSLLRSLPTLVAAGTPVLVGTSRKTFLGAISVAAGAAPLAVEERFEASLATAVWAMCCGAAIVRVHDVKPTVDASRLVGGELALTHSLEGAA